MKKKSIPPLPGGASINLLRNPDRGLRLELYMNVHTGESMFEYAGRDAFQCLRNQASYYQDDYPTLAQVYFYLTDYWSRPLDDAAFRRMEAYFTILNELGLKALLRFAYTHAMEDFENNTGIDCILINATEPAPAQMVAHLQQLRPFLYAHRKQIHVLQAGLIGVWGEWHQDKRDLANQEHNHVGGMYGETAILQALIDNSPPDMYHQVRMRNMKTLNLDPTDTATYNRVGYHDDFIITAPHHWNTGGHVPGSADWRAVGEESLLAPMDGEMIWGASVGMYHGGKGIDAEAVACRLYDHHFTSLSMVHNYCENEGVYDMVRWKEELTSPIRLTELGLPFHPAWFLDSDGMPLSRSMFEYIRDYLGYYLVIECAGIETGSAKAEVAIRNYGFAPPLGLTSLDLAMLDTENQVVCRAVAGNPSVLLPGESVTFAAVLPFEGCASSLRLAVAAYNSAGTLIRFANDVYVTQSGYHLL
ncbi:MAG: DUF4874 domain-containing protein [Defluviitaleaceae bacterium]|nr:DUF4874 domain-containing protein [Defluviitaleaceae bacterium]